MQTLFILYNTHHPSDYPPSLLANARWKPVLIQPKKSQTALFPLPQVSLALTSPHPFHSLPSNIRKSSALNLNPSTSHSAWILSLLILSGDIETNPGPPTTKYPCGVCSRPCRISQPAIQCDTCDTWIHKKCLEIDPVSWKSLANTSISWHCLNCALPNFSSSLFDDFDIQKLCSNSFAPPPNENP